MTPPLTVTGGRGVTEGIVNLWNQKQDFETSKPSTAGRISFFQLIQFTAFFKIFLHLKPPSAVRVCSRATRSPARRSWIYPPEAWSQLQDPGAGPPPPPRPGAPSPSAARRGASRLSWRLQEGSSTHLEVGGGGLPKHWAISSKVLPFVSGTLM